MAIEQEIGVRTWRMLIGGQWVDSSDGGQMEVWNPARAEVLGKVPLASAQDVGRAVEAAKGASPGWWGLGSQERAGRLRKLAQIIREHADDLTWLDAADSGNPIRAAKADVLGAAAGCEATASHILDVKGETVPASLPGNLHYTVREPFGVVGVIIPFNHPTTFALSICAPLAVGNAVILKPSEQAPLSALLLGELCREVFPAGVVNIVTGDGPTTGASLVRHPDVRLISFTGSVPSGQRVVQVGAEQGIKTYLLELGGKNPLIVFPDADLPRAVNAAVSGMNFDRCQGQSCGSTSRVLLHRSIKDEFVERLATQMEGISMGDPLDPDTVMGSLISRAQWDRVTSYIERGKQEGARLAVGGTPPRNPELARGCFVPATLFDKVNPNMTIAQEEIFGPVLSAMEWETEEEALAIANGVRYGLTSSLWTQDLERAHWMASQIQAGRVFVNSPIRHFPGTPFGKYKDSGIGESGPLDRYTQLKAVHIIINHGN